MRSGVDGHYQHYRELGMTFGEGVVTLHHLSSEKAVEMKETSC